MTEQPAVVKRVEEIYDASSLQNQLKRYEAIHKKFVETYNEEPKFFARAPGRVNLIGEHIDYSGYSVLPMAIENDIVMAVSINSSSKLNLANMEEKYLQREYDILNYTIDSSVHEWSNYFLAGFKRFLEVSQVSSPVGMKIVVSGTVPSGSGLSSSSAMVCCSVLSTSYANNKLLSKKEIAEIAITGERYVGVEGGGMDQSISMMGEKGKAKLVDFHPLQVHDVILPQHTEFLIANSLVTSDKKVTAPRNYNLRVVECRLSSVLLDMYLQKDLKVETQNEGEIVTLIQVQKKYQKTLEEMMSIVQKYLHSDPYSREELASLLSITVEELHSKYMSKFPIEAEGFALYSRSLHVFSEANRVYQFKKICEMAPYEDQLKDLGELMNSSQESCKTLFNCSCPELDEITQLVRNEGGLGSRLTGAGWGGCTVSLIKEGSEEKIISQLNKVYYSKLKDKVGTNELNMVAFTSKPGNGALILDSNQFSGK